MSLKNKEAKRESQLKQQAAKSLSSQTHDKQDASLQYISYLETSVSHLEKIQQQLDPINELIVSVPLLKKAEGLGKVMFQQSKQIEAQQKQYEKQVEEYSKIIVEVNDKQSQRIQQENQSRAADYKQGFQLIYETENNFKQQDLENKLSMKNLQVWSKEEIIVLVENFETKIMELNDQLSQEMETMNQRWDNINKECLQYKAELTKKIDVFVAKISHEISEKNKNIAPAIGEYAIYCKKQLNDYKEDLSYQLSFQIQKHCNEMKKHHFQQMVKLSFRFSQEMILLRQEIQKIRNLYEEKLRSDLLKHSLIADPESKIKELNQQIRTKLDYLQDFSNKSYQYLEEILVENLEILIKFDEKVKNKNKSQSQEFSSQELKQLDQEEIRYFIETIRTQLQFCQQNLDRTTIRSMQEVGKIQDNVKKALEIKEQAQKSIQKSSLDSKNLIKKESELAENQSSELNNIRKDINSKNDTYLKEIQNQKNITQQLLARAIHDFDLKELEQLQYSSEKVIIQFQKNYVQVFGGDEEPQEELSDEFMSTEGVSAAPVARKL